jgi:hypothetical protein
MEGEELIFTVVFDGFLALGRPWVGPLTHGCEALPIWKQDAISTGLSSLISASSKSVSNSWASTCYDREKWRLSWKQPWVRLFAIWFRIFILVSFVFHSQLTRASRNNNISHFTFGFLSIFGFFIGFNFTVVVIFSFLPQISANDNHYLTSTTNFGFCCTSWDFPHRICSAATSSVSRTFSIFSLYSEFLNASKPVEFI